MRKIKFVDILFWTLAFLPLLLTLAALPFVPDSIPVHSNSAGEIDRWGSKYELFIIPFAALLLMIFFRFLATKLSKPMRGAGMWSFCVSGLTFLVIDIWWLIQALNITG